MHYKKMPVVKVCFRFLLNYQDLNAAENSIQFSPLEYLTLDPSSPHRMPNELTKMNHPKSPKSATHRSNQDENEDPQKSAAGKKAPVHSGVSRLPVLAKSLHLPTPSSFSLSNCKWEEKPLAVSVSFSSRLKHLRFINALVFNSLVFSCREKPRSKSRAPDLRLSAVHIPRL